jgi:DNA topoisomerase II
VAIDSNNYPTRYETPEDILSTWCPIRLSYYQKRYDYMVNSYTAEIPKISNKYRFVELVVTKQLDMYQSDEKLEENMVKLELMKIGDSYDYLLNMHMRSMTEAKLKELKHEVDKLTDTLTILKGKSSKDLWLEDLDAFEVAYTKYLETYPLIP